MLNLCTILYFNYRAKEDLKVETEDFAIDDINDEFFSYFTCDYDKDKEGNAISTKNKKGKWSYYQKSLNIMPSILN